MVFEGAFEKIFSIIKEEGGSEGGVVVQVTKWLPPFYLFDDDPNSLLC